jgi:hypothetical protein
VLARTLGAMRGFWKRSAAAEAQPEPPADDLIALGWMQRTRFATVAREVVVRDIVEPLAAIGITLTREEREELL